MSFVKCNWFPILFSLITFVSLYDTLLVIVFSQSIGMMEENPLGQWLIRMAAGDVGIFVRTKLAGTLIVLTTLTFMRRYRSRKTLPVKTSIAAYQTGLFTYLTFA